MGNTETPKFEDGHAAAPKGQTSKMPDPSDSQQEYRKDWEKFLVHDFKQHFPHISTRPDTLSAAMQARLEIYASQSESNRNAVDLYYLGHGSPTMVEFQEAKERIYDSISRISIERPDLVDSFVQLVTDIVKNKPVLKKEIEDYATSQETSMSLIKSAERKAKSSAGKAVSVKNFWKEMEHALDDKKEYFSDDMNCDSAYLALRDRILGEIKNECRWTIPTAQEDRENRILCYAYRRDVTNVLPFFKDYPLKIKTQSLEPHEVNTLENFRKQRSYNSIVDNAFIVDLLMLRFSPPGSKERLRGLEGVLNVIDQKFAEHPGDTRLGGVFTQCVLQSLAGNRNPEGQRVHSDFNWAVSQVVNHAKLWELAQIRINDELSKTVVKGCFKPGPQTGKDDFSREP